MTFRTSSSDMLLVVDVQRDFCEGGALAVPEGKAVVAPINALMHHFDHVAITQDWHPAGHISFASSHTSHNPFDMIELGYGLQTLWPDHCVRGTSGAEIHPELRLDPVELVLRKGFRHEIDSYSAFIENDRQTPTGLAGYLRERGIERVVCAGLALDYCVRWSAEDAVRLGFEVVVMVDACRAIGTQPQVDKAIEAMRADGIDMLATGDVVRGQPG